MHRSPRSPFLAPSLLLSFPLFIALFSFFLLLFLPLLYIIMCTP